MNDFTPDRRSPPRLVHSNDHLQSSGGGSNYDDMADRLARLETGLARLQGAMEGARHAQNMTLGVLGLTVALGVGFGVYILQRIDQLDGKVNALPDQINANLRDITKTLADSITAARSDRQPTVIVLPPPSPQTNPDAHTSGQAQPK